MQFLVSVLHLKLKLGTSFSSNIKRLLSFYITIQCKLNTDVQTTANITG